MIKFADDTKVWGNASKLEDRVEIQDDLDRLVLWAEQNQMRFNRVQGSSSG